jgi:hypothetical protein
MEKQINLDDWYTARQAAEVLSRKRGKLVATDYPRKLAEYGKVRTLKVSDRASLYWRVDIDKYEVEDRGKKAGRAKHEGNTKQPSN